MLVLIEQGSAASSTGLSQHHRIMKQPKLASPLNTHEKGTETAMNAEHINS